MLTSEELPEMDNEPDFSSSGKKPRFDGTVNLGHVLTMLMMGAALLTMWTNTKVTQAEQNSRISVLEKSQSRFDDTIKTLADNASAAQRTQDKLSLTLDYLAKQVQPTHP